MKIKNVESYNISKLLQNRPTRWTVKIGEVSGDGVDLYNPTDTITIEKEVVVKTKIV